MSSGIDPSTLNLTPRELSKMSKKDLANHLSTLQEMYTERGRKYEKAKSIIRKNKQTTQANHTNVTLIPKPPGRRSRDFNIFDAMKADGKVKITKATYNNLINSIHVAIESSGFDMGLPLKDQEMVEVTKVIAYVQEEYPFIGRYRNAWPVTMLARQFMNNRRGYRRENADADTDEQTQEAGPPMATTATDPDNNGNGDGDQDKGPSDVSLSDIDD